MEIKVYNSLTNQIEEFKTLKPNEVSMYVCGPTVYSDSHIGNARPVIFFDTVKRFLQYVGYKVKFASNFTDIDDKIINAAIKEGISDEEVANKYIAAYLDVCEKLGCEMDIIRPRVTENIDEILEFVKRLVDHNSAYVSGDDVYYDVNSNNKYGILSNQKLDELEIGSRIEINTGKKDPRDFTLWKKTKDIGRKWASEFGLGRPGWHTECVVMIHKIFGGMIDIHGGGIDLKFPHHENEIAQNYSLYNNYLANFWIHNARIDLKGEKMSKSLGNIINTKDIIKIYEPQVFRLAILSNHYRQIINYQEELMIQMKGEWEKIVKAYISLYRKLELNDSLDGGNVINLMDDFLKEMAYDFNTSNAITHLFSMVKIINTDLRKNDIDLKIYQDEFKTLKDMLYILGLNIDLKPLSSEEKELVNNWLNARKEKNFSLADELRNKINELGIKL